MSDEHQQAQTPEQTAVAAQPNRDARPAAVPGPPQMPDRPVPAAERVRLAVQRRGGGGDNFFLWAAPRRARLPPPGFREYTFFPLAPPAAACHPPPSPT